VHGALVIGGPAAHDSKGAVRCCRESRSISASVWLKDMHSRVCNNGLGNRNRASDFAMLLAEDEAKRLRKKTRDTAV
jgi:hypothetical protein